MIRVDIRKTIYTAGGTIKLAVNFEIEHNEFVTLFGESGAGKTTILRMIAGLTDPDEGLIKINDDVWFDSHRKINRPARKRQVGFVFQDYALFPNMTIEENLKFALSDQRDASMMDELLAVTGLAEFRKRSPQHLSGGQKQRAALIRALLRRPAVFLLDEPLSALDLKLRITLQDELLKLHKRFNTPTLFVSHDVGEVYRLSNRILLLENGIIKKEGHPDDIFGDYSISGKFRFPGIVLDIQKDNFLYIITVQIGHHLSKVAVGENETADLKIGDKILVAAKAFNPVIFKI